MVKDFQTDVFNIRKKNGDNIHAVFSYIDESMPTIIISPPFQQDMRTMFTISLYMLNNGFNVLRYDNTYHQGDSSHNFNLWTPSAGYEDLMEVIRFAYDNNQIFTKGGVGLIGADISSRIALRYLSLPKNGIDIFVSIYGVLNMQYTMKSILGFNLFQKHMDYPDERFGIQKVIHSSMDLDNYVEDCFTNNYINLEDIIIDINKIVTPVAIIASEKNSWVNLKDYIRIFACNSKVLRRLIQITNAGHEFYRNPATERIASFEMVKIFSQFFLDKEIGDSEIIWPTVIEITQLNKNERKRGNTFRNVKI